MGCGRKEPLTDPTLTNIFCLALRSGKCGGRIRSGEESSSRKAVGAALIVAIFRVYLYGSIASLTEGSEVVLTICDDTLTARFSTYPV